MTNVFQRVLVRAFANAFARKIVALILLGIAAAFGYASKAQAQSLTTCPNSTPRICDQGQAYAAATDVTNFTASCRESPFSNVGAYPTIRAVITGTTTDTSAAYYTTNFNCQYLRSTDQTWQTHAQSKSMSAFWVATATCASRPPITGLAPYPNGSIICTSSCSYVYHYNGDGSSTKSPTGATCLSSNTECATGYYRFEGMCVPKEVPDCLPGVEAKPGICKKPEQCPTGMHETPEGFCEEDGSECPAGNIKAPSGECLPGEGQCAVGEARRPNGTCGKDSNGDGVADDDDEDPENDSDKETFSGGDNCSSPPSCSGSPIMCGQARIQWRIDCNTRKNVNIAGGSCAAVPICTGEKCNAMEYSSLLMQWRTACATEKLLAGSDDGGSGGQPEWTKVGGMSQDGGAGQTADDVKGVELIEFDTDDLDQSGFGGAASCPALYTGTGEGMGSEFVQQLASPPAIFCTWIGAVKAIMILFGTIIAAFITVRMH